jgi:predicted AlkP superfamily phosphohydrolase/phosphomutase
MNKVFVFGIDGAPPELIFDKWIDKLPNIKSLINKGCYAKLNSTIPPSTIIAWNSMMSGKDTSEIGVFSYTYKDYQGKSRLVNSSNIKCKLVWDILSDQGKKSVVLYVPLSYPVKPINGVMVSDFLTPGVNSNCAYPEHIKNKISSMTEPEIFFDVAVGLAGHKGLEVGKLIEKTYIMTDMQVQLLKENLKEEDWDFFMAVMIGTDRLQHMLWNHFDETHRRYLKDSKYKNALLDFYIYLDKKLGEILKLLDEDTTIIVASDHGMVKQEGKININNWLIENKYLVLKENVVIDGKTRFNTDFVDMPKTIAYGGGAYNARIYLNKEKLGESYPLVMEEIIEKIKNIPDDKGKKLDTRVYKSNRVYKNTDSKECPDLTVYFDDLRWASNPDLGQEGLYSWHTAVGADSAGHSRQGSFILVSPKLRKKGYIGEIDIRQIAPTVLKFLDSAIPEDIEVSPLEVFK